MPGGPSLGRTLVIAGVVHVALFFLAGRQRVVRAPIAPSEGQLTFITVEPSPQPVVAPAAPTDVANTEPSPSSLTPQAVSPRRNPTAATEPVSSAVVAPESNGAAPSTWTLRVAPGAPGASPTGAPSALAALALDGTNHFMGRRETPEEEARAAHEQANRAAGEAMRGALHDSDVALGLGGGGPVGSALESAVRESTAPDESHAVLIAIADATGTVLRVEVESSSDNAAYRDVAEAVFNRLRGQKVRVPQGSHGLAMRFDVASRLAMPSGGGVGIDPRSMGGHFDMSDLGAKPRRVIHARVLGEELL
jgi:hypothetical protein